MAVRITDKILPLNDAFVGMVDANQVVDTGVLILSSMSGATISGETIVSNGDVSGATMHIGTEILAFPELSGSHHALSGTHYILDTKVTALSGMSFALSGSYWDTNAEVGALSGMAWALSGAHDITSTKLTALSGMSFALSGSYHTHSTDDTDPHGATLLQTNIGATGFISGASLSGSYATFATANVAGTLTGANIYTTGDNNTNDTAYVPMVLHGTDDTPPTASNFPRGTIYIKYTS